MKNLELKEKIISALTSDSEFNFKEKDGYLVEGKCPNCGKQEVYVSKAKPLRMECNRKNKCGWFCLTQELYPDLWNKVDKKRKHFQAEQYLIDKRGFPAHEVRVWSDKGWFTQGWCRHPDQYKGTPTVRWNLRQDMNVFNERLINPLPNQNKTRSVGSYRGLGWVPPDQVLATGDDCFLVEGCIDVLSLIEEKLKAVACISANHFPVKYIKEHKRKKIRWIVALDADQAGRAGAVKMLSQLQRMGERAELLLLPDKRDWNDLYRARMIVPRFIEEGILRGRLSLAKNKHEAAYAYYLLNHSDFNIFSFKQRMYRMTVQAQLKESLVNKLEEQGKGSESDYRELLDFQKGQQLFAQHVTVQEICNVDVELICHEELLADPDSVQYVLNVNSPSGIPKKIYLEGSSLTSARNFENALLTKAGGASFAGTEGDFKFLKKRILSIAQKKKSYRIDYLGYIAELGAYVYDTEFAFYNGQKISKTPDGYFMIDGAGVRVDVKNVSVSTTGQFSPDWLVEYEKTFGLAGVVLMAFAIGSLFVTQIRSKQKSFPFFELSGLPGAGKTTMLEFMWNCFGRASTEGVQIVATTEAAQKRIFTQLSNMPLVIIESDPSSLGRARRTNSFSYEDLKPLYNGRSVSFRGVKNLGNDVLEGCFKGTILFSQNEEISGSPALIERIVFCHVDKEHFTKESRDSARWFEKQTVETVGGLFCTALMNEKKFLNIYYEAYKKYEQRFDRLISNHRIVHNHAQIAACAEAMRVVFPQMTGVMLERTVLYIEQRAVAQMERLNRDHPMVTTMWKFYHSMDGFGEAERNPLNYSSRTNEIGISLSGIVAEADKAGIVLNESVLRRHLPTSSRHQYLAASKNREHPVTGQTKRVMLFRTVLSEGL